MRARATQRLLHLLSRGPRARRDAQHAVENFLLLSGMTTATATPESERAIPRPLTEDVLRRIDAYWRAANYLSVGQIYLLANPLLREPLRLEHVKPRLLGHWGTTPGLNFIYAHFNRII